MGKRSRRKRQNDPLEPETDTSDEEIAKKCTHLAKGINLPQLRKVAGTGKDLHECEDCAKLKENSELQDNVDRQGNDDNSIAETVSRDEDDSVIEPLEPEKNTVEKEGVWICLQCGHRGCGRDKKQHALEHFKTPRSAPHDLIVDSVTWLCWCYKCDDYVTIESARLTEAIEFIRKHYGLTGKPTKMLPVMKRSQSQFDAKEQSTLSHSEKFNSEVMVMQSKTKTSPNDSLPPVKGLSNLGNTCFFNSVMQVLSQTHWLTQLLDMEVRDGLVMPLKGSDTGQSCTSSCSTLSELDNCDSGVGSLLEGENSESGIAAEPIEVTLGPGKPLTLTLASFLKEMHCPSASFGVGKRRQSCATVTPSSLFNQICKKSPQFRGFQQQDAHELLRHLLDGVRVEEIIRWRQAIMSYFNVPLTVAKNQTTDIDPQLKRKLKVYGRETAHTFVDKLFGGQLINTVICETCRHPYQILEPFMDLSLPVSEDKLPPGSKRKPSVVDSLSCLTPPTPETLSKHQMKKQRKVARKPNKHSSVNKSSLGVKCDSISNHNPETDELVAEQEVEEILKSAELHEPSKSKEENGSDVVESSTSLSTDEDKDPEEGEGGDIEDNDDIVEISSKLGDVRIDNENQDEEDSISQHKINCTPNPANKKMRSEWIARSLCTLAVRHHSSNSECSVHSCLNLFTAPELLTGANKYGCENCTRRKAAAEDTPEGTKTSTVYSVASKQMLIFAPPAILTLHLKRFTQNGFQLRKAQKHVEFPLQLDLAPFCSAAAAGITTVASNQKEVVYSLYGVIEHSGRLSGGHYTAYVKVRAVDSESVTKFLQRLAMQTEDLALLKDRLSNRLLNGAMTDGLQPPALSEGSWYYCSDAHVMPVTEERVLRAQAFLLFYERIF